MIRLKEFHLFHQTLPVGLYLASGTSDAASDNVAAAESVEIVMEDVVCDVDKDWDKEDAEGKEELEEAVR